MVLLPIFNGFLTQQGHLEFSGASFLAEIFEKVSFDRFERCSCNISDAHGFLSLTDFFILTL